MNEESYQDYFVIIDGDQYHSEILSFCNDNLQNNTIEYISAVKSVPIKISENNELGKCYIKVTCIQEFTKAKKEAVDKFIGMRLQQAVIQGFTKFMVFSNDRDYLDIFGMLYSLNPDKQMNFKMVSSLPSMNRLNKEHNQKTSCSIMFI